MPDITIIDDEIQIAELLAEVGQMAGYEVKTYTEAKQFLRDSLTEEKEADVIFLDLSMPEVDGIEVINHLGKRQCLSAIFLMSGFDEVLLNTTKQIALEYELNIVEALNKPMNINHIKQRLDDLKSTF